MMTPKQQETADSLVDSIVNEIREALAKDPNIPVIQIISTMQDSILSASLPVGQAMGYISAITAAACYRLATAIEVRS